MVGRVKPTATAPDVPTRAVTDRRGFIRGAGAAALGLLAGGRIARAGDAAAVTPFRFGLLTDAHYADIPPRGTRSYRDSAEKLSACVRTLNEIGVDFVVELGDLKDQDTPPDAASSLAFLRRAEDILRGFSGPLYHVMGNHDVDSLSKGQFLASVVNTRVAPDASHFAWSAGGLRFVALDACYDAKGAPYDKGAFTWTDCWVPAAQLDWLREELRQASAPVIVFAHQRLDGEDDTCIRNAAGVRAVLEASGRVLAVFHGHHHAGAYTYLNGVHYYTLRAMVEGTGPESNAYAVVELTADRGLVLTGYGRAVSMALPAGAAGTAR